MNFRPVVLIFLSLFSSIFVAGQTSIKDIESRLSIHVQQVPLATVVQQLFEDHGICFGFEQSTLDRDHSNYDFATNMPLVGRTKAQSQDGRIELEIEAERLYEAGAHPITLDFDNATLQEVLDALVAQMQNYRWEFNDGVVNVYPVRGRDARFAELLNTQVKEFRLSNDATVNDVTLALLLLREFGGWLHRNDLHFNPIRTGSKILIEAQYHRKIGEGIAFSDLSFRELLNAIARKKRGGWILKRRSVVGGREHINLDI